MREQEQASPVQEQACRRRSRRRWCRCRRRRCGSRCRCRAGAAGAGAGVPARVQASPVRAQASPVRPQAQGLVRGRGESLLGLLKNRGQCHAGTVLRLRFVGGTHEREDLNRLFRRHRSLAGLEELHDFLDQRLVAYVVANPDDAFGAEDQGAVVELARAARGRCRPGRPSRPRRRTHSHPSGRAARTRIRCP